MKKSTILFTLLVVFISCNTEEPEVLPACQATQVSFFEGGAFTNYIFESDGNDGYRLKTINVYEGTDSAEVYTYSYGTQLESITHTDADGTITFNTVYENDKLSKVTEANGSSEMVMEYNGSNITVMNMWVMAPDANLYQIAEMKMTYSASGNLTKTEQLMDIVALIEIGFGGVPPTNPYTPALVGSMEYEYGTDNAPNPLYGIYNMDNPDMSFMKNLPISYVYKDETGTAVDSESITLTFNDKGFPTKGTFGSDYVEITYVCD
ncbi:MAG: hypothetical protein ABFS32_15020 [Bacteroidota bacterium]